MKKIILAIACMLAVVSCQQKKNEQEAAAIDAVRDSLNQIINQKDSELNDILGTFNDIQEGFRQINEAEGRVNLESNNPEKMNHEDVVENISFIQRTLQLNRERIARLNQQLKSSSLNTSKLKASLDDLTKQLQDKEAQISQLETQLKEKDIKIEEQGKQISSLNDNVSSLTASNEAKANTVSHQDRMLNQAWYVFGTKKELKEQGIVKSGDVLKTATYNKDYFTKIDIRVVKSIKLYSKSARLLTSHPSDSYRLEQDAQHQYTLFITNPQRFWSISKYLVILVK
ncbi:MAG: hypothetical protein PUH21_00655 [Prevotellaceae bacterium]|nr:hypothetical protein [Prevotellaceae bacterium]MDY3856844.1 hypothetical protein [Bacteroidaceae bacterium]